MFTHRGNGGHYSNQFVQFTSTTCIEADRQHDATTTTVDCCNSVARFKKSTFTDPNLLLLTSHCDQTAQSLSYLTIKPFPEGVCLVYVDSCKFHSTSMVSILKLGLLFGTLSVHVDVKPASLW
ncbi:hypothetical protein ILYODFUR_036949 [Ilyodon furcidens]|uniref:Uncharacterized protein n=1 Tax=Ilyodon furcidens TaxID=33524 RepID=A0ABV0TSJ9_9TELE